MNSQKISSTAIIASLKSLPKNELSDLTKALARLAELQVSSPSNPSMEVEDAEDAEEKSSKPATKAKKPAKEPAAEKPKKEPAQKGAIPPQLVKNKLWVDFVLDDMQKHGWPEFVKSTKSRSMDVTNETIMPCSILEGEYYVFKGQSTMPTLGDAMQLSKVYWCAKDRTGAREDLWELFIEAHGFEESSSSSAGPKKTSRRTLEEYNAERAAAKLVNDAKKAEEKAIAAAERKRISDEKKALKEEQAAQKKAEREAAKAEKQAAIVKMSSKRVPLKATAVIKASTAVMPTMDFPEVPLSAIRLQPMAKKIAVAAVKPVASIESASSVSGLVPPPIKIPFDEEDMSDLLCTAEEDWVCEEGASKPWTFKGIDYFRDSDNIIYNKTGDRDAIGVYCPITQTIDTTVEFE